MHKTRKTILALSLWVGGILGASAFDLTPTSPTVSENFNSMTGLTLPDGWKVERNLVGPRQVGVWNEDSIKVMYTTSENLSSTQSNGTYAFYSSADNNDRAIGGLTTGSVGGSTGTRGINLMTKLSNADPSKIITNIGLKYNIEKYRNGSNGAGFSVRIFTSPDGSRWTEVDYLTTSFDPDKETLGAAVVPITTMSITNQNLRTHVEAGNDLYVAWNISVTSGTTCSSAPGYAIDDIELTATFADDDPDWVEDETPEFVASGIYLRGEVNSWAADSEWEFSKLSDTEYALYKKTVSGIFKIGDSGWTANCNYGSNGTNIMMGMPYTLQSSTDSGNISCGNYSFNCSRILLTIDNGVATLTLEPNEDSTGLTTVYMFGDFNNWNYMSTTGKLDLDPSDNLFKGQVGLTAAADGLAHWMIYQRLGLAGAWGLEADATQPSSEGTLLKGQTGHVASEPGMYDVTFNLKTGEYTLTELPSMPTDMLLQPEATVLVPVLPGKIKVLSLNNSLIHYNDQAKVFNDIASSMGKDATWTKHTNLGKTLDYHWSEGDGMTEAGEPGAKMMVRSDAWSHIILQEQTALPRTDFTAFRASVEKWVGYIRDNCPNPNAVIILPLNWALGQDWSNFTDNNKALVESYNKVAEEFGVVICPVGLAYQSKFETSGGTATENEWFLPGDDRHPTLRGTYLAALMEYGLIFNEDPETVSYYPNYKTEYDAKGEMSDAIAAEMRGYAKEALEAYKNVVDHHSSTVNLNVKVLDQYGMELPVEDVEWSVTPNTATVIDGVFKATANGTYTVTASTSGMTRNATINVTDAVTEVPEQPYIALSEDNLEYTQDFDSMGEDAEAPLPEGWRIDKMLSPREIGTFVGAVETTASSGGPNFGSSAKNGSWNLYDSSDPSDRALGGVTTDVEGGAKSINIYAHIKNEGKKTISDLDLTYNIEKYRNGSNSAGFTVKLFTSVDGKNWTAAGNDFVTDFPASSATAGSSVVPIETQPVTGNIAVNLVPGAELFLGWNISATTGTSCSSAPILAIDDVAINSNLKPVPVFDYYIYINNQAGYEKTGLYAWSEGQNNEIFGGWPGQAPIDTKTIDGVVYEVFGHNESTGKYFLIYNNNNNGSQLNDYAIDGGRDYYFNATPDGLVEVNSTSIENVYEEDATAISFDGTTLSCPGAITIRVYSVNGALVEHSNGETLNVSTLPTGIYVTIAETPGGHKASRRFAKR